MKLVIEHFNSNVSSLFFGNKYFKKHKILNVILFSIVYLMMLVWMFMLQFRFFSSDYRPVQFILLTCFLFCFLSVAIILIRKSLHSVCKSIINDFNLTFASNYMNIKVIKKTIQIDWLNRYFEQYNITNRNTLLSIIQSLQYHEINLAQSSSKRFLAFSVVGITTITYWANKYLSAISEVWNTVDMGFNNALLVVFTIILGLISVGVMQVMINTVNDSISDLFISEERKSIFELIEILEEMALEKGDD